MQEREASSNQEKIIQLSKPSMKVEMNKEYKKGVGKYINPAKLFVIFKSNL